MHLAGQIFGWGVIGILVLLAIGETLRFRRARRGAGEFPYPPRRLARRLAIAALLGLSIGLIAFWPADLAPKAALIRIGIVLIAMIAGLVIWLIDLHETSKMIVDETNQMTRQMSENMMQTIKEKSDKPDTPEG